jgi:hypothetical protein
MDNVIITQTGLCFSVVINVDGQEFTYSVDNVADQNAAKVKLTQELQDILAVLNPPAAPVPPTAS